MKLPWLKIAKFGWPSDGNIGNWAKRRLSPTWRAFLPRKTANSPRPAIFASDFCAEPLRVAGEIVWYMWVDHQVLKW